MNTGLLTLVLVNYAYIGLLPRLFFRKDGAYNMMWFITAAPIFVGSLAVINQAGQFIAVPSFMDMPAQMEALCVILYCGSIALISYTLGTHRVPLALWHQTNDAPVHIVTWGAYKLIRHPFYTSFLTANIATFLLVPNVISVVALIWSFLILNKTAAREEKNLASSQFGSEYQSYMTKTGRFFPKVTRS